MRTPWTGFGLALHNQVADIARTTGRFGIAHVGTRRVQTVTANTGGRDIDGLTRDLESPSLFVLPTLALRFGRFDVAPDGADEEMLR